MHRQGREDRLHRMGDAVVELVLGLQQRRAVQLRLVAGRMDLRLGVFRGLLEGGALGVADMVPGRAFREQDAAVHVQPVHLEGGVEGVQQGGVVGIAHILGVELPVVVDDLAVGAQHLQRPRAEIALEEARHGRRDPLLDRRHIGFEGAEDEAAENFDADRLHTVAGGVEILRHAALALQPAAEGHAAQPPVQVVGPGVVDAGEEFSISALG